MKYFRTLTAGLFTLAATSLLAGCLVSAPPVRSVPYAYTEPPARPLPYAYSAPAPAFYGGYVVHVDTAGYPFIYVGKTPRYLPREHSHGPYSQQGPYSRRDRNPYSQRGPYSRRDPNDGRRY